MISVLLIVKFCRQRRVEAIWLGCNGKEDNGFMGSLNTEFHGFNMADKSAFGGYYIVRLV